MPTYDYRCTECDREVEVMHGIHASGPETCEHCGGAMRKALSPPAIHFKGKGWAKKDAAAAKKAKPKTTATSGSSKSGDDAKSTGGDAGKSEKSSSTKSEDKSKAASTAGSKTE